MKIFVAGHKGLVGSAIVRAIEATEEHTWIGQTREQLNLLDRTSVLEYVQNEAPDGVIIAAAKVGGIHANASYPVEFLSENLQIETNLIDACHIASVENLLFLGSSCIYPKDCPQPIKEEYLLTGPLEPTNEAYALAKISGLKLIDAYRTQYGHGWVSAMPTNLYGPGDNFHPQNSHVLPAMIRRFHEAKTSRSATIELWGTGAPLREFLHADDFAKAALFTLVHVKGNSYINIGSGEELSIAELAQVVKSVVGYHGEIIWDTSKPNGTPRKLLDSNKIRSLGWKPEITLESGIRSTYEWYLKNKSGD